MHKRLFDALVSISICIAMLSLSIVSVCAVDNKYDFDEIGLSIKMPDDFTVITRHSERTDNAFAELSLDYDETMTAFSAANIFLQATSQDKLLKITLSMVSDENSTSINNYDLLTENQLTSVLDAFLADSTYTSGVEIKHNDNIFFDLYLTKKNPDKTIYGYQCHTVINGTATDLTIQKDNDELTIDEIKIITGIADTMDFSDLSQSNGPSFDWWRILLWIVVMVIISLATVVFFRKREKIKKQQLKDRRDRRRSQRAINETLQIDSHYGNDDHTIADVNVESKRSLLSALGFDTNYDADTDELSFEESLGYDTTDYKERAATDLDALDISVKQRDLSSGVSFFEDSGKGINDKPDYFDNYFKEQVEPRPMQIRFISAIGTYIKIIARHTGFFFVNLYNRIKRLFKHK